MRILTLTLMLAAALATWFVFGPRAEKPPSVPPPGYLKAKGDAFFAAAFKQFSPAVVALRPLRGKPVVAYFWASGCKQCPEEAKALQAVQKQVADRDLVVVGLGVDQADRIERFARDNEITFAVFVGGQAAIDLSKKLGNLREQMPFVVAIDRQGSVVASHLGKFGPQTAPDMAAAALR